MPAGDPHVLQNGSFRVVLLEDATHGLVLQSIENRRDGASLGFAPQSLFRIVARRAQRPDAFLTLTAADATSVVIDPVARHEGGPGAGMLLVDEAIDRGPRSYLHAAFTFAGIGGTPDGFTAHLYVALLDGAPERALFSLVFDPSQGGAGLLSHGLFWAAPVLLAVDPFAADHYLLGMNGGTVTRAPRADLVGDGASYRFHVGTDTSSVPKTLDAATGFEPEAQPSRYADRMEVMYPTWLSIALSGYGDRGPGGATLYVHDELRFRPRRVRDVFEGGRIRLEHEVLVENGIAAGNGWGGLARFRADGYVALFRRTGDVLGEEIGLHYRRFARRTPEGRAITPPRPLDRTDNGPSIQRSPILRVYFPEDDGWETGITEEIADEFRLAFPALASIPDHPLYRMNYDLLYEYNNTHSGTLPGAVGNTTADLFAISADPEKVNYAKRLRRPDRWNLWTYGAVVARRPTPFDGRGLFESQGMGDARVRNHHDALDPAWPGVDDHLRRSRTVANVSFNGTFTRIELSAGAFEPWLWEIFSHYSKSTGGIDHAAHASHLGWLRRTDGAYAFPIEKRAQAEFLADPPSVRVAGDRTGTIQPGDALDLHFVQAQYVPGYRAGAGMPAGTSMCAMADAIGNGGATIGGWATTYVADFIAQCRPWLDGVFHVLPRLDQVCWHDHGGETPGSNQQLLAWRRVLERLRADVLAAGPGEFQIWEEDGPYDWLLGLVDGHTRTDIRLDLASEPRSWGASPLFQVVWGDRYRFGGQLGDRNGHVTNFGGLATYEQEFMGAGSLKWREAMAGDFMLGRLPSLGIWPVATGALGTRPDGQPAYTPFFHVAEPMTSSASYAALFARLTQFQLRFDGVNVFGRRVRSLRRTAGDLLPHVPVSTGFGHSEVYNIGIDELGPQRAPLCHHVMRDASDRRKLVALFVNPDLATRRAAYRFDPADYEDTVPPPLQGWTMTRHAVQHDGVVPLGSHHGSGAQGFAIELGPAEVQAVVIEFDPA